MFDRLVWGMRSGWVSVAAVTVVSSMFMVAVSLAIFGRSDPSPLPTALGVGMGVGMGSGWRVRRSWQDGEALTVRERFAVFAAVRSGADIGGAKLASATVSWANLKRYEAEQALRFRVPFLILGTWTILVGVGNLVYEGRWLFSAVGAVAGLLGFWALWRLAPRHLSATSARAWTAEQWAWTHVQPPTAGLGGLAAPPG